MYSLRNRPEKLAQGLLFCLFLKLVQINFIFTDNVRILYMSQVKGGTLYRYFIFTSKRWIFVQIFYCHKSKVELCTDILLSQVKGGTLYRYFIVTSKKWNFVQIFYFILQSVNLLYKYAIRINFCFIRTRRISFSAYE